MRLHSWPVWRFAHAVGWGWVVLLGGSLLSGLGFLFDRFLHWDVPPWACAAVAIVCAFVAFYRAWLHEFQRAEELVRRLDALAPDGLAKSRAACLDLRAAIADGEESIVALEKRTADPLRVLETTALAQRWLDESRAVIAKHFPEHLDQLDRVPAGPSAVDAVADFVPGLYRRLQRLRDFLALVEAGKETP